MSVATYFKHLRPSPVVCATALWYIGIIFMLLYRKALVWRCAMSMAQLL